MDAYTRIPLFGLSLREAAHAFVGSPPASESPLGRLNLLPLAALAFDFLENAATSIVMARYPLKTPLLAQLAGVLTSVKWLLVGLSFTALFLALGLIIWKLISKPEKTAG